MLSLWDKFGVADWVESFWDGSGIDAFRQEVADWIGPQTGRFLDLGCGTARMAPLLTGCRYVGVDGSEEMLRIARTRVPIRALRLRDLNDNLPFKNASFDAALCMEVIRHLSSYEVVLKELARVVKSRVYIVDAFDGSWESHTGTTEAAGQTFPDNRWSLPQFLTDVEVHFPEWWVKIETFSNGATGIRIEAP